MTLSLGEALAANRLPEFIAQVEASGIGPADRSQFDSLMGALTAHPQADQTSRSPARGSKRGK